MDRLAPTSKIACDIESRELFFQISGFWQYEGMQEFLRELSEAAKPFFRKRETFGAIGNLSEFVPQDRQVAGAIRDKLLLARKNGLSRFAVVSPPPLVKLQYKRIGEGLEVDFFDDVASARNWLRQPA